MKPWVFCNHTVGPGMCVSWKNIIQQAIIFAKDGLITSETLPPEILENAIKPSLTKAELQDEKNRRTETIIRDIECSFLKRILSKTRGNITRAAEISGYDRRQIQNLTKKHDINTENFK